MAALGKTQKTNTTHRPMLEDTNETYRHLRSNKNRTVNSSQIPQATSSRRIEEKTTTETRKKTASNSTTQSSDENNAKSDNSCVDARSLNVNTSKALIFTSNKKNANNKLAYMLDKNYNNLAASSSSSSSSSLLLSSTSSSSSSPLIIYNSTNTRKNIFKNNNNNINNSSSSIFNATKQPQSQTPPNIPTTTTTTNTIKTHLNKKISITSSSSLLLKKKYKKLLHGHRHTGTKTKHNSNNSLIILKRKKLIKLKNSSKSKSSTAFSSTSSSSSSISSFSTQVSNRSLTSHKYEADNSSTNVVGCGANSQLMLASKNDDLNNETIKTSSYSDSKDTKIDAIDSKQNERKLINLFGHLKRSKSAVDLIKYGLRLNEEEDFKKERRNKLYKSKSLFNLRTTTTTMTTTATTNTPQVSMNEILHGQETHSSFAHLEESTMRDDATKSPVNSTNESIDDDAKSLNIKEEKLGDGLTNGFASSNKSHIKKEEVDEEEALVDKENFLETKKEFLNELLNAKKEQKVEDEILVDMGNEEIIDGFAFLTFELEDDLRVI